MQRRVARTTQANTDKPKEQIGLRIMASNLIEASHEQDNLIQALGGMFMRQ